MSDTCRTIYASPTEQWHIDRDGRLWYLDLTTEKQTELIPGNPPEGVPLPAEFFQAFGQLVGHIAAEKEKIHDR